MNQTTVERDWKVLRMDEVEEHTRLARNEARSRHRSFASWHEAYAVIREELDEFWDGVKADDPDPAELMQMAACCQLAVFELLPRMLDESLTPTQRMEGK